MRFGCQHASIFLPKSTKILPKIDSKMHHFFDRNFKRFFYHPESILKAKRAQDGPKRAPRASKSAGPRRAPRAPRWPKTAPRRPEPPKRAPKPPRKAHNPFRRPIFRTSRGVLAPSWLGLATQLGLPNPPKSLKNRSQNH